MSRRRPLKELQEAARLRVREALRGYELPRDLSALTLGCLFDGEERIFELYLAGERPVDAKVLARVRVDSLTAEAGAVEVFLPRREDYSKDEAAWARQRLLATLDEIAKKLLKG